ncbi:cfd9cb6b-10d2-40c1-9b41-8911fe52ee9d [Sclerotinia trifoliorum]|uniref:Cfd9cb6b-10d2-40c1-9b41-8911fe52ee9d n=1 Tax=Sclerotinia trifoliorum TaxID=28548 RepID=A0A8H2VZE8_9HELO|nr:cfd9cb6b-10d2-40c1-9b41-8911fe52ee9d [Sclerotinia trifoliorum]
MGSQCNECIKGTIHAGLPIGHEETVHGLNTYVVGNPLTTRATVVIYSDIFGHLLPNNKLLADAYAASGEYLVYLPDFFEGDPVNLKVADLLIPVDATKQGTLGKYTGILASMPSFLMWMGRHKEARCTTVCNGFLEKLRVETKRERKIGMVGFCWGGRYAIRAALEENMVSIEGEKKPLIDAVVALHPSNLVFPRDVDGLVVPVSYGWGENDVAVNIKSKGIIEEIHRKEGEKGRSVPEMEHRVYKPGRHGFAVRGNPDDPQERACLEDSMNQGLQWLGKWL